MAVDIAGAAARKKIALSMDALVGRSVHARDGDFLKEMEKAYPALAPDERVLVAVTMVALLQDRLDGEFSFRFRRLIARDRDAIRRFLDSRTAAQLADFCSWYGLKPDRFRRQVGRFLE